MVKACHAGLFIMAVLFLFSAVRVHSENAAPNDTLTIIHQRKSVRNYTEQNVEKEKIDILLKAGMAAPTARDKRPWHFVAVTDRKQLDALASKFQSSGKMLFKAGAAIAVCADPKDARSGQESEYWVQDCSAASENILLAAEAQGLGAVWLGVYPNKGRIESVKNALGIPKEISVLNVISIGYPLQTDKPKNKFDASKIHWQKWQSFQ